MLPLCQSCVALKGWRELLWTSTLRFSDNLFFNEKKWGVGGEGMGEAAEQLGISMNKKKKKGSLFSSISASEERGGSPTGRVG